MRTVILNAIFGLVFGWMLLHMGYNYSTWEFWAMCGLMVGFILNSSIR